MKSTILQEEIPRFQENVIMQTDVRESRARVYSRIFTLKFNFTISKLFSKYKNNSIECLIKKKHVYSQKKDENPS